MRCVLLLLAVMGLAGCELAAAPRVAGGQTNVIWLPEMPTGIHQLFRDTIAQLPNPETPRTPGFTGQPDRSTPPRDRLDSKNKTALIARHLQTLESLRQMPWPSLDGLERICYRRSRFSSNNTNLVETAWLIARKPSHLDLLTDDFGVSIPFSTNWFTALERLDFKAELQTVLGFLGSTNNAGARSNWRYANLRYWHEQAQQYVPDLLRLAYAAAWHGHTNEAIQLVQCALKYDVTGAQFEQMVINEAARAYDETMRVFDSDAARSQVLAAWEKFIKAYPQSPLCGQLTNYTTELRRQVAEFPKLAASAVENPEGLPVEERARYYQARFPEIQRRADYGFELGAGRQEFDAKLVQLGYAALPVLIEHLTDTRLTRMTSSPYGRPRHIVRVQDQALRCIRSITKVRFSTQRDSELLSEQSPEQRNQLLKEVRDWWNNHGNKSPLEGQLARLDQLSMYERISTLQRLEGEYKDKVDALDWLRKWARETAGQPDRWRLAEPLARHGDLSLLPLLREQVSQGNDSHARTLLRYGGAEDYAACRQAAWLRTARDAFSGYSYVGAYWLGEFAESRRQPPPATNWLAVPLLADLLEFRQQALVQSPLGTKARLEADPAMVQLALLTGYAANYQINAPLDERLAAMDRWLDWWQKLGQAQFKLQHPETAPVFIETPITSLPNDNSKALVSVFSANRFAPVVYDVPPASLASLLASGSVRGMAFGLSKVFWFASAEAEELWWVKTAAKLVPPATNSASKPPAMRVQISGGAWPDSESRIWACWQNNSHWPAIFDGKSWRPFAEKELPPLPQLFTGFSGAMAGNKGAMFFLDSDKHIILHDSKGWLVSSQPLTMAQEHPERVRRSLPFPPLSQPVLPNSLTLDAVGNVWCTHPESDVVAIAGNKRHALAWPPKDEGLRMGNRWLTLLPLAKGPLVLAVHSSGRTATLALRPTGIVIEAEQNLRFSPSSQRRPLRDSRGWLWLSGAASSVALDKNGQAFTNHAGQVLLEDKRKAIWFVKEATAPRAPSRVGCPPHRKPPSAFLA